MSIVAEYITDLILALESDQLNAEKREHYIKIIWHNATWVIGNYNKNHRSYL